MQGRGVDIYNLCDTGETAVSVTTYTGHSTGTGPKVLSRKVRISSGYGGVCGTLCALMYRKNCNQDNLFYIINQKESEEMEETEMKATPMPMEYLKKVLGEGKDVLSVVNLTENLLSIVASGTMTVAQAIEALQQIKASLKGSNDTTPNIADDENGESDEEVCIVRRLTPTETSRLQGFPDDYTKIDGPETSDAPQFKAHGNSWATPCANFVSTRMEMELRRLGHEGTIRYATCCSGIEAHSVAVSNLDWKALFFSEIEPFPCHVLAKHYPAVPNLGDMTQIHYDADMGMITNDTEEGYELPKEFLQAPIQRIPYKIGGLEVFSGGTPCFVAGTMVLTEEGYKPIEKVRVNDRVMTHLGRLRKVTAIGKKFADNVVAVTTASRQPISCTADHKFWSAINPHQDYRRKSDTYLKLLFDGMAFRPIEDVGVGGYVAQLNRYDMVGEKVYIPSIYNATPYDSVELAGWYVGDGHCRGWKGKSKKALILSLSASKVEKFKKAFGDRLVYGVAPHGKDGVFRITISNTEICNWLESNFGAKAYGKTIPAWIIGGGREIRERFIAGYMATDGFSDVKSHLDKASSTTSFSLALGLADLFGKSCIYESKVPETKVMHDGRTVHQRHFWGIRRSSNPNRFHEYGMWNLVRVRKIEPQKPNYVYNITVEEDHSYIVHGLCVKNCQSVSVAGKREGMAENSGTRSSLAFHFQRIIDECKPTFTIWENVPGAFSSNGGADFIWFVNRCAESGYAMAWRVLDAQYVMTEEYPRAVPQRRRRIWLVGYCGNDWRIPARIVFEKNRDLTDNPPDRIPGIGFKMLNPDADIEAIRKEHESSQKKQDSDAIFDLFSIMEDSTPKAKKVSQMIPLDEFPDIEDFAKVRMVDIFEFAKKIGEPGYLGDVFRKDKKTAVRMLTAEELAKLEDNDAEVISKYEKFKAMEKNDELQWEGAEKIAPDILENIGNAGILANGRILTMDCHEWTAGIQLSPSTYNAWEQIMKHKDWLKANDLLPEAYDETVCGLSDVLQEDPDEKYNLSWRACFGILRRAETRGKELPEALEIALISNIRENACIVKWVALYGRDTKKKPTDMTEREIAQTCFDKYIASVIKFEDVVAEQPSRKAGETGDPDFDDEEEEQEFLDDEANEKYDNGDEEVAYWERSKAAKDFHDKRAAMPDLPNGCINESGGETAPTIVASQYKGPGNTQDATIVATKKEGRFPKEENA